MCCLNGLVNRLLARKQLEIVTGGWVMNDEANAHYYSILQQLTHGHHWLQQHLNVTPRYHTRYLYLFTKATPNTGYSHKFIVAFSNRRANSILFSSARAAGTRAVYAS